MAKALKDRKQPFPVLVSAPWLPARSDLDQFFDRFADEDGFPSIPRLCGARWPTHCGVPVSAAVPEFDVIEREGAYQVTAALPGLSESDIDVCVSDDMLVLRGEQHQDEEADDYLSEPSCGAFQQSFVLPDEVDRDRIYAEFGGGVLTLTLPKTAEAR